MFIVIDLETTSREPAEAHIVEWAAVVLKPEFPFGISSTAEEHGGLIKPPVPIPPQTSAVHHIIDADVVDAPPWTTGGNQLYELLAQNGAIAVAHNAEYERTVLTRDFQELPNLRWLCSYKAALRVWPNCPSHSNECLRYFLGFFGTGRRGRQAPHSAMHDARVTAKLLGALIRVGTSIDDMIRWTTEPALLPRCPIGKYRNLPWAEVPADWLEWAIYKAIDMRADVVHCARTELKRRLEG